MSLQQAAPKYNTAVQRTEMMSQKLKNCQMAKEQVNESRGKLESARVAATKTEETKTAGQESKKTTGPSIPPGLPINGDGGR